MKNERPAYYGTLKPGILRAHTVKDILPWLADERDLKSLPQRWGEFNTESEVPPAIGEIRMKAKRQGQCVCCRCRIDPGQSIVWHQDGPAGMARHSECDPEKNSDWQTLLMQARSDEYCWYINQTIAILAMYPGYLHVYGDRISAVLNPHTVDVMTN